jgi:hypothetical protein
VSAYTCARTHHTHLTIRITLQVVLELQIYIFDLNTMKVLQVREVGALFFLGNVGVVFVVLLLFDFEPPRSIYFEPPRSMYIYF